jgi:hypothetical protein
MNALDDLLASTGRVEDITPDGLCNGRVALESTIDDARALQARERPSAAMRSAGLRRKIIFGCTAAAVAAAALTVVPRLSGQHPAPGQPSLAHSTAVTAAFVFREAANATKADPQQEGWPHAAYWHVASIEVRDGLLPRTPRPPPAGWTGWGPGGSGRKLSSRMASPLWAIHMSRW